MSPDPIDTVIEGGTLVGPDGTTEAALGVDDGRIVTVGDPARLPAATERVDATGRLVLPGVVDPHVHAGDDPFSEDTVGTASRAAALGGVTTFLDFAWEGWDGPNTVYDPETTLVEGIDRQRRAADAAVVDYGCHGTLASGTDAALDDLAAAVDRGVTSFKLFTAYDVGVSTGYVDAAFRRIAALGAVGVVHTEDGAVCERLTEELKSAGRGDPTAYPESRPAYAEAMAADDVARLAVETGVKYYGVHTSCAAAAERLAAYREDGSRIRAETCTNYLLYDESAYEDHGTLAMAAPPLRTPDDVAALYDHLRDGVLSVVSTDHVAFTRAQKEAENWWDSPFGTNNLQHHLVVLHDAAVANGDLSRPALVRYLSTNPARTFGLPGKGTLAPGTDADLVVFDPDATQTIRAADNASNADVTVHEGREVEGRVEQTFVRGERVAVDGEVVAPPGHGEFVEREVPTWEAAGARS
jgi:dihydropyrimidinase